MATSLAISYTDVHGDLVVEGDLLVEEATGATWTVVDGSGPAAGPTIVLERAGLAGGRRRTVVCPEGRIEGFVAATW
jgi:hypothetical protein